MVVLSSDPRIDLDEIAYYFYAKWHVVADDYTVEFNNTSCLSYLQHGLNEYKTTITNPDERLLDADFDNFSISGYSIISN